MSEAERPRQLAADPALILAAIVVLPARGGPCRNGDGPAAQGGQPERICHTLA